MTSPAGTKRCAFWELKFETVAQPHELGSVEEKFAPKMLRAGIAGGLQ
jgi:hypothetical protein